MRENISKSYICKYNNEIENLEKSGIKIVKLISAQPDIETDESYFEFFKKISNGINPYTDCKGLEILRKEFSEYYNEKSSTKKFNLDDFQITLGASDAIISLLMTICNRSVDEILLIEPFFSDYKLYCQLLNINYTPVRIENLDDIKYPNNYKVILFSNPNNPTGNIFNENEINKIIEFARKNDIYIISDEVYSEIVFDSYTSFCNFEYDKVIVVDSVSKKLNNCGARIGCILTKNKVILNQLEMVYDSRISISNVEQMAVLNLLKNRKKVFEKNLLIYKERKEKIQEFLEKQDLIKYDIPKGGVFFLLTLPVEDTEKFASWLLKKYRNNNTTIAILPANDFFCNEKNKIRLPMTYNLKYTIKGLNLLIEALKKYQEEGLK